MRVAVLNRERSAFLGGDLVHIDNLSAALLKLGVQRDYINNPDWTPQQMKQYDLLHVQHCSFTWSRHNFKGAVESGVPWVVTCCFYPTENLGMPFDELYDWFAHSNATIVYSKREWKMIRSLVGVDRKWLEDEKLLDGGWLNIIPPGVSQDFHYHDVHAGDGREGVLTVAARDGAKNTDRVRAVCERMQIPYRNAINIPRAELPSWYRNARVYVNATDLDQFGLAVLEGLAAGCRTIISPGCWSAEHLPGVVVVDPLDEKALEQAVYEAYELPIPHGLRDWDYTPNRVARGMTWDLEAERVKKVYEEVLGR